MATGGDPLAEKRATKLARTVNELLDDYLASDAFAGKAPSTQSIDRGRIDHHLRPTLGKAPLPSLSATQVERAFREITAGKTAVDKASGRKRGRIRATGGAGTARMSIRLFRSILAWGVKRGSVTSSAGSTAAHVEIGRDGRRSAILEDEAAYARMFQAIDRLSDPSQLKEGERLLRPEVADAIRLIALTGARRGEIVGLRWSDVSLTKGLITLPAEAHKTGRKTGESRVIGLPALGSAIIERQPAGKPSDLVFRPARGGQRLDIGKPWRQVCSAAELPVRMGLHGLRHSLASHMAMQGAEASQIMTALGHRDISTSQRYVHWASDQRQSLAETAAQGISATLRRVSVTDAADVPTSDESNEA